MGKFDELIKKCKCGIHLTINIHRDYHETVEQHFESNPLEEEKLGDINVDIYEKMKELDTIVELQFYPDTPIGSYTVYHYNLDGALDGALKIINE